MNDYLTEARREGALEFRARCARIFRSDAARGRLAQAKVLALETDMSATEAISVLSSSPLDANVGDVPGMKITNAMAADAWARAIRNVQ